VADFYARRDLSAVTAFTDPNSIFEFGFETTEQLVINKGSGVSFEVSFDGENVHGRLDPTGPSSAMNWVDHVRKKLWIRRVAGGPAGAKFVEVLANTR
jgi:hypothetical protein